MRALIASIQHALRATRRAGESKQYIYVSWITPAVRYICTLCKHSLTGKTKMCRTRFRGPLPHEERIGASPTPTKPRIKKRQCVPLSSWCKSINIFHFNSCFPPPFFFGVFKFIAANVRPFVKCQIAWRHTASKAGRWGRTSNWVFAEGQVQAHLLAAQRGCLAAFCLVPPTPSLYVVWATMAKTKYRYNAPK